MRGTTQNFNTNGMTFTNRKFGEQTTFEARSGYTNRGGYSSAPNRFGTYNSFDNESFTNGISQPLIFRQKPADETIGGRLRPVDYKKMSMKPLQKNFYREHAAVHRRDQAEIDQFIEENNVTLNGPNIPRPVFEFGECHFPETMENLLYCHYKKPTVIQSITWPVALSGRDLIGIAQTGSGKTLGFLLPGIIHTIHQIEQAPIVRGDGPIVLILLPTRELAQQVEVVAKDYCKAMNLGLNCLFGGASKGPQAFAMKKGIHVCVATPGRLLDFLESDVTNLRRCSYLVLDEADRMLDMGFEPQIRKIISQIRPDRQTLMFSATWPQDVRALARDFQTDAVFLNVGSLDLAANHNVEQIVEVIGDYNKQARLFQLLEHILSLDEHKTIIFCETKRKTDDLTRILRRSGVSALCIHGDKSQDERDWVMEEFRSGRTPILLATDVAARGLDVRDVKFVINFDYPNNSEDYVHRIGRTGRMNQTGTAYTFFTQTNAPKARDLIKVMEEANQSVPPELLELVSGGYYASAQSGRYNTRYGSRGSSTSYGTNSNSSNYSSGFSGGSRGARGFGGGTSFGNDSAAHKANPQSANKLGWSHWDS